MSKSFDFYHNHNLKSLNTFGFSCIAKHMLVIQDISKIEQIFAYIKSEHNLDIQELHKQNQLLILGSGSNLLLVNDYYDGLVIHIQDANINIINNKDNNIVCVNAGYNWHNFVQWSLEHNFYGLENLALIPGTVGASPIQNIGAYGVEVEQYIKQVEAFNINNNRIEIIQHQNCNFSYRDSIFKQTKQYIILKVYFDFSRNNNFNINDYIPNINYKELKNYLEQHNLLANAKNVFNAIVDIRTHKLPNPAVLGNSGSFFKNPIIKNELLQSLLLEYPNMVNFKVDEKYSKVAAGWLIDNAGWKGYTDEKYQVGVYPKQALVLVNYGQEQGKYLLDLAHQIQKSIQQRFGIDLEIEVNLIS